MAECEITTGVFSAGQTAAALGIRKGWMAEAADQLIDGKRYVGLDATAADTDPDLNTTKGHQSIIVEDCGQDCKTYGSMFSRGQTLGSGRLRSRARINPAEVCSCAAAPTCFYHCRIRVTVTGLTECPSDTTPPEVITCLTNFWDGITFVTNRFEQFPAGGFCGYRFEIFPCTPQGVGLSAFTLSIRDDRSMLITINSATPGQALRTFLFDRPLFFPDSGCHTMDQIFGSYDNNNIVCTFLDVSVGGTVVLSPE